MVCGVCFVQWFSCFALLTQQVALCSQPFCVCSGLCSGFWSVFCVVVELFCIVELKSRLCSQSFCLCSALWSVFCAEVKLFCIAKSTSSFVQSVILFV